LILLCSFSTSIKNKPIVLLPGLYGSQLYGTYGEEVPEHWYCPKTMNDEPVWIDAKLAIPPVYNCLFEILCGYYNETTKSVTSKPGIDLHPHDFGGVDGISKIIEVFGLKFYESFSHLVRYFKERGYEVRKDLWGCPYDWRIAITGLESTTFYTDIKSLIEESYNINGCPITILGYSLGGFVVSHFLGRVAKDDWKKKYIEKAIFLAPAFAGAGDTLPPAYHRNLPVAPFMIGESVEKAMERMPCLHILFPNHIVFADVPVIYGPNGEKTYPKDLPQFLIDHHKVNDDAIDILMKNVEYSAQPPANPNVPLLLVYNNRIDTLMALNFSKGFDEEYEEIYAPGDGTVPSKGPEWACKNWKVNYPLICYNIDNPSLDFNHGGIGNNPFVNEIIFNYTNIDDWYIQPAAVHMITAPLVAITKDVDGKPTGFKVLDNIRPLEDIVLKQ